MISAHPLSRPVKAVDIGPVGRVIKVRPIDSERAALAKEFDIVAIKSLTADVSLKRRGKLIVAEGQVKALVTYACIVSLEPFDADVDQSFQLRLTEELPRADHVAPEIDLTLETEEPPDLILDGTIDAGAIVAEFLSLGLDPFPRKPGAVFAAPEQSEPEKGPFAKLSQLKSRDS